jgi:hypothetical protein
MTEARARLSRASSSVMSISCPKPHSGGEHRECGLHVDAVVARAHGERVRFGGRQAGFEASIDQQAPHLLVGDGAHQVLDVDTAVAQRATLFVGLCNLCSEGDYSFKARLDLRF